MCGIAGVINFHRQPAQLPLLASMLTALTHRGPDSRGRLSSRACQHRHAAFKDYRAG